MKALSIHPTFARAIAVDEKTVECRTWSTDYRGDILICSTAKKFEGTIPSHALAVVELYDIQRFTRSHMHNACMYGKVPSDSYAWMLRNARLIEPIPIKGRLSLWNFDAEDKIKYIPEDMIYWDSDTDPGPWYAKYWEPLIIK